MDSFESGPPISGDLIGVFLISATIGIERLLSTPFNVDAFVQVISDATWSVGTLSVTPRGIGLLRRQERMNVSLTGRLRGSAGRIPFRGLVRVVAFAILASIGCVGCRNTALRGTDLGPTDRSESDQRLPIIGSNPQKSSSATGARLGVKARNSFAASPFESRGVAASEIDDEVAANDDDAETPGADRADESQIQAVFRRVSSSDDDQFVEIVGFQESDTQSKSADPTNDEASHSQTPIVDNGPRSLRLSFPPEIPGAMAPRLMLPRTQREDDPKLIAKKMAVIDMLFPPPTVPKQIVAPHERTMDLEELEELALQHNPIIAQALASITMSQGKAIQSGVYPNPVFGYEADTVGSSFTRNYQGIYVSQQVKTAGKVPLQRAAANMELMNAQLAYERTQLEVLRIVRARYYDVLVSQESTRINDALTRFANEVYSIMIERLKQGQQAAYELSQLNGLVNQARAILVQSQNRYLSAWKQLAVATGVPELPLATLEGRVDMPVPNHNYDVLFERMLSVHPDLHASRNLESQSRLELQLQKVIPIPDITVGGALQNDSTVPGYQRTSYNLNVSVPIPIFDRNQGNIRSAVGKLNQSSQQYAVARNQLTNDLADAFERYQTGRVQAEYYRNKILPDLARAYLGVYERHISNSKEVAFGDIIVAQQNLATGVGIYITTLSMQWGALTDIANLIQLREFRELLSDLPSASSGTMIDQPTSAERGTATEQRINVEGGQP